MVHSFFSSLARSREFQEFSRKIPQSFEPITIIIYNQLDIKLGQFTQEELDVELTKMKNGNAAGLDEMLSEVWKTRKFDDILLRYCNEVCN